MFWADNSTAFTLNTACFCHYWTFSLALSSHGSARNNNRTADKPASLVARAQNADAGKRKQRSTHPELRRSAIHCVKDRNPVIAPDLCQSKYFPQWPFQTVIKFCVGKSSPSALQLYVLIVILSGGYPLEMRLYPCPRPRTMQKPLCYCTTREQMLFFCDNERNGSQLFPANLTHSCERACPTKTFRSWRYCHQLKQCPGTPICGPKLICILLGCHSCEQFRQYLNDKSRCNFSNMVLFQAACRERTIYYYFRYIPSRNRT